MDTNQQLYLDLIKKCLTRIITEESFAVYKEPNLEVREQRWLERGNPIKRWLKHAAMKALREAGLLKSTRDAGLPLYTRIPFDRMKREIGRDWPLDAETMIGLRRLDNLQACIETIIKDDIPGDLVEAGVWRGGASIFMRAVLRAYQDPSRRIWCADSFRGLPAPNLEAYPQDKNANWHTKPELAVSREVVEHNFAKYGLLDDRVTFLEGWFKDTLPCAPITDIALLRLDGDMYESTMDALKSLYSKVSPGGFVIIDDYGLPEDTCRRAVHDFRDAQGISEPILDIDGWGAFWQRKYPQR